MDHKKFNCSIKSIDDAQGKITGYLSIFGNEDSQGDVVWPGAFKKTISEAYSRKEHQNKKYLLPMLWMHDPEKPIGGYTELHEDKTGLYFEAELDVNRTDNGFPLNQLAMSAFSGCKQGYVDCQSIGYEPIIKDYDSKTGVRNLREIRLWEGSLITMNFSANDQALLSSVKNKNKENIDFPDIEYNDADDAEYKTVCGSTSGPIGPRDEKWSGSAAKKWIWSKALDSDGKVKAGVAKRYFMRCDGDPSLKTSYGYPFWINDHISVGGVKAVAGALAGARNANPEGDGAGMRRKVEALYRRINAKYPDETELTPPWKGGALEIVHKGFEEHYRDKMCADLLEDFDNVLICSLCCAILDAVKEDDVAGVNMAVSQFQDALDDWLAECDKCNLPEYLEGQDASMMPERPYDHLYGYMARDNEQLRMKSGARISKPTKATIEGVMSSINARADQMVSDMQDHVSAMKGHVNDLSQLWQEQAIGPAYAEDVSKQNALTTSRKTTDRREPPQEALSRDAQPINEITDDELQAALAAFSDLNKSLGGKHANSNGSH